MKIQVIFTGGTIGSTVKEGWADVDHAAQFALLKPFESDAEIEFSASAPFSVLSENLSAKEINSLQNEIQKNLSSSYDGIIVTHGTDTLQYAATAAEFAFADAGIPIVFVSADYPLENPKTNGYDNFKAAVELIKSGKAKGVFVSYRNQNQKSVAFHIPSRLLQHREFDADLFSLDPKPFASYENEVEFYENGIAAQKGIGKVEYILDPGILSVESCPGNRYSHSLEGIKAILLKPYHSGTLDTANPAFCAFCVRAKEKKIPLFVTNPSADVTYKSTELYETLGITLAPFGTYVSVYMKIWAAISLGKSPAEFFH